MEEYETVILVKQEVFVFQIPPRATNRGYRAADWKLQNPDWSGRMRVITKGKNCFIKLEDKVTGELFAKAPIENYPGIAIEAVMDSSRYFVLRIEDDNGRAAFIGIGFSDRGDSFDMNVALQEHFKYIQKSEEIEKESVALAEGKQTLDLGFKEGQTITINMNIGKKSGRTRPKSSSGLSSGTPGLLPPPPGGIKLPPPISKNISSNSEPQRRPTNDPVSAVAKDDLLLDLASLDIGSVSTSSDISQNSSVPDLWGDFTTATGTSDSAQPQSSTGNWIDF